MKPLLQFPQTIKTPRLVLKVLLPALENAKMILEIIEQNRDYLEEWQGHFMSLHTVEDVQKKLESRHAKMLNNQGVMFGIYRDNNLIGRIRFFNVKDTECEIGYWLIKSVNGHGFMSEALKALESELFKFGFDKIILNIDAGNEKSQNVANRNGYKLEKTVPMASWAKCVGKCDDLFYAKDNLTHYDR